ncbi:MAG: alpha/beta fold hydrolase [Abitibacteriaceae bacterium]|nr:alpha/beta fold hydrolase [Abditibacteriaceae bacterium]
MQHRAQADLSIEPKGVVVMVSPFAEEKKAAQRALVEAGRALADAGFEVLRFDLRGTGDSGGEFGAADVEMWREDLRAVIAQARALANDRPISLIGLRFGATLAWLAAHEDEHIDSMALWEPITSGATYMRQNRQRSQIRRELTDGSGAASNGAKSAQDGAAEAYPSFDFDGFLISSKLHREMVEVDLLTAPVPNCRRVQLLQISGSSRIKKPLEDLRNRAVEAGVEVELDNVAVEAFWSAIGLVDTAAVRGKTIAWLLNGNANEQVTTATNEQRPQAVPVIINSAGSPPILAETLSYMSGDQRVHGVLYRPDAPVQRAVLLLHGWSGYRIGPGHLLTEAARSLAAAGYAAYSFDFRGRGESEWGVHEASLNSMIRDACRAVSIVLEQTGASHATLLGLCSGGEVALGASLSDTRIDSLALWSAPVFSGAFTLALQARRSQDSAKKYVRKLFYPETWAKLFTGRLNYKMIARALSGGRSNEDAGVQNKAPDTASQMKEFEAFKGRLCFIYGGNDPETPPSRDFYREFVEHTGMPHEFHEVEGANHNYYGMAWKQRVIETTVQWLASSSNTTAHHSNGVQTRAVEPVTLNS